MMMPHCFYCNESFASVAMDLHYIYSRAVPVNVSCRFVNETKKNKMIQKMPRNDH